MDEEKDLDGKVYFYRKGDDEEEKAPEEKSDLSASASPSPSKDIKLNTSNQEEIKADASESI